MRIRVIAALAAATTLTGCLPSEPTPEIAAAQRRELTAAEKAAIGRAVALTMKDPDAAEFIWAPFVIAKREGISDYCGLVNGKNAYGGYVGYQRFYSQLQFDGSGKLINVFPRGIANGADENGSMEVERALCSRYGYGDLAAR